MSAMQKCTNDDLMLLLTKVETINITFNTLVINQKNQDQDCLDPNHNPFSPCLLKLRSLDPHPSTVYVKVLKKTDLF